MEFQEEEEHHEDPEELMARSVEALENSGLTLEVVLRRLDLKDEEVLNVYLMGSKLWGNASAKSDWDFLIVHGHWKNPSSSLHSLDIDATVLTKEEYLQRLNEHHFLEVITLYLPAPFVWKEAYKAMQTDRFTWDPKKLEAAVVEELDRDWRMTKKCFEKKNVLKGKKIIVHAMRMLEIAVQLAENQKVTNWFVALPISRDMDMDYSHKDWNFFGSTYTPKMEAAKARLHQAAQKKK